MRAHRLQKAPKQGLSCWDRAGSHSEPDASAKKGWLSSVGPSKHKPQEGKGTVVIWDQVCIGCGRRRD